VIKDYHYEPLSREIDAEIFSMGAQSQYGMVYIKIKPNTETTSLKYIEETYKKLFPLDAYSYTFKVDENLKALKQRPGGSKSSCLELSLPFLFPVLVCLACQSCLRKNELKKLASAKCWSIG